MNIGLVLLTDGTAAVELAAGFRSACAALRAGDRLIVTDSGSDPDLTAAIDTLAHPEALPEGASLTVLRFGAVPPGSWGAQANVALAEAGQADAVLLLGPADHLVAGALQTARDRLAVGEAEVLLAGGDPPPRPEMLADRLSSERLDWALIDWAQIDWAQIDWALSRPPAPALVRASWLRARGLRLPESGPSPDRRWLWQLCALAGQILWQAAPLGQWPPAARPPGDADTVLALHQSLLDGLPADLSASAHAWLIGELAGLAPDLDPASRWPLAQRLAERLASCPDPLWQQVMARHGHRQAAVEADALRRGQVLDVIAHWTRAATELRLARLETKVNALQDAMAELAALRRGLDSLCRIAEFDALSPGWPAASAADPTDRDAEDRRT